MLTNPNTCGLFERDIVEIAKAVHEAGAYFYCDGANLNAILGKARPGDLGVDCMHINLHKTFSTPHGGGGPGAGPVVLSERLAAFAPLPYVKMTADGPELIETPADAEADGKQPFGRMTAFHGQMGMFVRAMTYMLSHGADGLRQASEDAVLNANYVRAGLQDVMSLPFGERPYMHEVLFDDSFLHDTGVSTLDFAKAMIDEGFHPMTMYFPLVVHGAMLIEPTESESKASLDLFVADAPRSRHAGKARRGRPLQGGALVCAAPAPRRDRGRTPSGPEMDAAGAAGGRRRRIGYPGRRAGYGAAPSPFLNAVPLMLAGLETPAGGGRCTFAARLLFKKLLRMRRDSAAARATGMAHGCQEGRKQADRTDRRDLAQGAGRGRRFFPCSSTY